MQLRPVQGTIEEGPGRSRPPSLAPPLAASRLSAALRRLRRAAVALTLRRAGAVRQAPASLRFSFARLLPTVCAYAASARAAACRSSATVGLNISSFVTTAQARHNNFRAAAHRATFGGFPAARNRS